MKRGGTRCFMPAPFLRARATSNSTSSSSIHLEEKVSTHGLSREHKPLFWHCRGFHSTIKCRYKEKEDDETRGKMKERYIIFGLGNPGKEYEKTRHNIGFRAVEEIAKSLGVELSKSRCNCKYTSSFVQTKTVYLAQPQTYMNLSGRAVRALVDNLNVPHKNVVVIFDEVNMPVGNIKLRNRGSGGGQNGAEDVIRCMGTSSRFVRLKFGIGKPVGKDLAKYVLRDFTAEETPVLNASLQRVKECVMQFLEEGLEKTMNKFNQSPETAEAEKKRKEDKLKKEQRAKEKEEKKKAWEAKQMLAQGGQQPQQPQTQQTQQPQQQQEGEKIPREKAEEERKKRKEEKKKMKELKKKKAQE